MNLEHLCRGRDIWGCFHFWNLWANGSTQALVHYKGWMVGGQETFFHWVSVTWLTTIVSPIVMCTHYKPRSGTYLSAYHLLTSTDLVVTYCLTYLPT
jgi:hypothetical protein